LANVKEVDVVVCPPFTALAFVAKAVLESNIRLGAQNMSEHNYGAFTGEIAAGMLKEFSVRYVILGHSERRHHQKESDELISKKAHAAHAASLRPIVCVGETLAEREGGLMEKVLETQIRGSLAGLTPEQMDETVVAYEPIWAIGTGRTATTGQAQEAHAFIRLAGGDVWRGGGQARAHSVRRQRQTGQRPRIDGAAGCRWGAGGRSIAGRAEFF
jgi:triosephosphate isomerase